MTSMDVYTFKDHFYPIYFDFLVLYCLYYV